MKINNHFLLGVYVAIITLTFAVVVGEAMDQQKRRELKPLERPHYWPKDQSFVPKHNWPATHVPDTYGNAISELPKGNQRHSKGRGRQ